MLALPPRSIVVMDNTSFHKSKDTHAALHDSGHTLLWLPPYPPDLNPIEKNGFKQKNFEEKNNAVFTNFF